MADDEVRLTIRASGGLMADRVLYRAMREEGVQVLSSTSDGGEERRDWQSSVEASAAILTIVVQGGVPAIKAALAAWRRHFPTATAEVEDERGLPPGYL